jgi:hypothetical protein
MNIGEGMGEEKDRLERNRTEEEEKDWEEKRRVYNNSICKYRQV